MIAVSALLAAAAVTALLVRPSRLAAAPPLSWSRAGWLVPPLALLAGGPALAAVVAVAVVVARRSRRARERERAAEQERSGAVEALGALAAELRAGRPAAAALASAAEAAAGPFGSALRAAAAGGDLGADPSAYLVREADRSAVPDVLRGLAACWSVCSGTGGALAPAVERLEEAVRAQRAQQQAVAAELAGPRATAVLLAGLPLAGLVLAAALGADPVHVLLPTPLGGVCLLAGGALDLLGLWWTGRIVAAAERA